MATTRTLLTLDQFRALVDEDDDKRYELSEGELIELPPPGVQHGAILAMIGAILINALDRKKFVVLGGDTGFLLDPTPERATVRGADVAVLRRTGLLSTSWHEGGPLLAVEVISPSNTASDMRLKVEQYLTAGCAETWLVYPKTGTIAVYLAGQGNPRVFAKDATFRSVVE